MSSSSRTRLFLNYLMQDNAPRAKDLVCYVNEELKYLQKREKLNGSQQEAVDELSKIIGDLENGQTIGPCSKAKAFDAKFRHQIEKLIKTPSQNGRDDPPSNHGFPQPVHSREDNTYNRKPLEGNDSSTVPSYPGQKAVVVENTPAILEYRSKLAGQAMRYNNPDIADLSDVNRPTKIAERFSELYDNEWTEAFEALHKKTVLPKEEDVITFLLNIVERAYRYCTEEAEKQIEVMKSSILNIMSGGTSSTQSSNLGQGLLVQYRKSIASLAIDRLVQNYLSNVLPEICQANRIKPPTNRGQVATYTKKAVELTWWMCVQDPPIHMCLSSDKLGSEDIPSMYKAYTKSGKNPDYYVWPVLKLHKEGGLLMKGVMQFK